MENNNLFNSNHQALVVLTEAASELQEVLRNQRTFQARLLEGKNLHNSSISAYGSHLLHTFHPHLIQSLNPSMISASAGNDYFACDRSSHKSSQDPPSFQMQSAFSQPKYAVVEQNLLSGAIENYQKNSPSPTLNSLSPISKPDASECRKSDYDDDKDDSPHNGSETKEICHFYAKFNNYVDSCPVCGLQLSCDEWNTHFLSELDQLYKLSFGMDRSILHKTLIFTAYKEDILKSRQNRWEAFQRIRTNRQSRLRIKVRKRKYGSELYFLESLFCTSCPICQRKFNLDGFSNIKDNNHRIKDEIETVDVENCYNDIPDSKSDDETSNKNFDGKSETDGPSDIIQIYDSESCDYGMEKHHDMNSDDSNEDLIVDDESNKSSKKSMNDDATSENDPHENDHPMDTPIPSSEQRKADITSTFSVMENIRVRMTKIENSVQRPVEDNSVLQCFICKT